MLYGYARISRREQNIERQIRNIKAEYPEAVIFQEAFTGTKIERPEWVKLTKKLKAGDTVVFDSVSRMSRNAQEGFEAYEKLYNSGVQLVFLKEPHINTETFRTALNKAVPLTGSTVDYILEGINRYLMELAREQIRIAFEQAEKEVTDLHLRTSEGLKTARMNGKQVGRKKGDTFVTQKEKDALRQILRYSRDFDGTLNDTDCMKIVNVSRNTFYKYKKKLQAE